MLKAYMDESGTHDGSPVLTVSAYLARPRQWQEWTKKWNVAKRPVKVFHSVDCQNFKGEFKGWDDQRRDPLVIRLLKVLRDSDFPGIVVGIHMDAFREAMRGHNDLLALFPSPYAACFQWVVQALMNLAVEAGSNERTAFIHETNSFRHEALEAFDWVTKNANPKGTFISLQFGTKQQYVPLQAADVLAYEGNKRLRDPDRKERRPWQELNPDGRIIAAHYGRENMQELVDRLSMIRDGKVDEIDLGSSWNRASLEKSRL